MPTGIYSSEKRKGLFQKGYNGRLGKHHSEETRKKMSETRKGKPSGRLGKHHSEETKRKMSEARKGKPNGRLGEHLSKETKKKISKAQKGNKNNFWGKHHLEKTKQKMSKAQKGNKYNLGKHHSEETRRKMSEARKGKKSCNWKGGIEPENRRIRKGIEMRLWREAVFARDNWTCQKYGSRCLELHPHHIQNFSKFTGLRFEIDNGITLSKKAHIEFHKKYGTRNNTKNQLEEFLNNPVDKNN